jgi:outer membrane protein assembly factor BamB
MVAVTFSAPACSASGLCGSLRPVVWGLAILASAVIAGPGRAEDWPTYGHDNARSQTTTEPVRTPLVPCWVFQPRFAPRPAWDPPRPASVGELPELPRAQFDDAFQVAVAGGGVFFGSSADNKVYCLDAASGQIRWTHFTGGPVRLAPTVAGGRVYFGSDDGYAYCLDAADGALGWQFHAAPEDRRVLGHGRMISLWPVRTGVLVDGPVAYFGAGIFPAEGVFLYAVDAGTGREIWRNDRCGEAPQSRVSPQGYLLASPSTLYAPMGRVSPAAFDRADGRLADLTFFGKSVGGTYALLSGEHVYTGTEELIGYRQQGPKDRFAVIDAKKLVVAGDTAYVANGIRLAAMARKNYPPASQKVAAVRAGRAAFTELLCNLRQQRVGLLKDITRLESDLAAALASPGTPNKAAGRERIEHVRDELAAKEKALDAWLIQYTQEQEHVAALAGELKKVQGELSVLRRWDVECGCDQALILAGDVLVAGGQGRVVAVDAACGRTLWTGAVEGSAKGLAVAGGRLFVSTDKGLIYCFGPAGAGDGHSVSPPTADPYAGSPTAALARRAAEIILHESGVRRGYGLVLGCETGELAVELAKRSELMIYAVSPDREKVDAMRKSIDAAGLYGGRICVERWPLDQVPYADYFANLIVSETALRDGKLPPNPDEMFRMLKPLGGVALIGRLESPAAGVSRFVRFSRLPERQAGEGINAAISSRPAWTKIVRGPLPGAGSWTHLYGNPGNTACGDDRRVKGPMGVLWFGHPGPGSMVNRHSRSVAPLAIDGRLFCEGEGVLMAYDAYNGWPLWERKIRGALRSGVSKDCGNLAIDHEALFAAVENQCLRIDPATGATRGSYALPAETGTAGRTRGRWGYVGLAGDLLIGSRTSGGGISTCLFAVDPKSGKHLWSYTAQEIPNTSISIGDGSIYVVDRPAAAGARPSAAGQRVVALDARTGSIRWQTPLDLTCDSGGVLGTMAAEGLLVIFGVYTDGHDWQGFFAGEFAKRRVNVLSAKDGALRWSRQVGYRVRPLIVGDTLHVEPWALDLRTGAPRMRVNPVTGRREPWQFARPGHHCGCPSASPGALFFRSYCLGYYDLAADFGTMHFGGQRPGCWINFIPACGLLLMPEASAGCLCPFPNMCSVVFEPTRRLRGFGCYSAAGGSTPVRRLAIALGAPGDRNDAVGQLWLGYPRPAGPMILPLRLDERFLPGGGFVTGNATYCRVTGTNDPWLFASAAKGLSRLSVPLLEPGDGAALYAVRLAMSEPDHARPGQRVFDVKLQGQRVLAGCDVAAEAGGPNRALVKEFHGILVRDALVLELVPKVAGPLAPEQMPILQGLEVTRERVVRLGCTLSGFQLDAARPSQPGVLQLTNMRGEDFHGRLEFLVPEGFVVAPQHAAVALAHDASQRVELTLQALPAAPPGIHAITARLVRSDGSTELEQAATIENLGRAGRLVIPASENAFVQQRYPDHNKAGATVLLVQGGDRLVGDIDHTLAYLKFPLHIPGRPTSVRLRLTNAGNPTFDSGRVCLVQGAWSEKQITYANRPAPGDELARIGAVGEHQVVECPLKVDLAGKEELSLVIDPTSCDAVDYVSRTGSQPPALVIEYQPE